MNAPASLRAGAVLACCLGLTACDNMKDQASRRPLAPSPRFADGSATRPAPAHTVARGAPAPDDPLVTGIPAGRALARAPVAFDAARLARGRERFEIYCAACHGSDGYGAGIVVRRGFPPPPSYHADRLRAVPDGYLFEVMTQGYGVMPAFRDRLAPADRWAIVGYIRALQRSQHATLADVPADRRLALSVP